MEHLSPGFRGTWWRFSEYSIREGPSPRKRDEFRYIVPAASAKLERYRPVVGRQSRTEQTENPATDVESLQAVNLSEDSSILDWCRQFGLLGILPHTVTSMYLAARWGPAFNEENPSLLFPTQSQFFRINVGWKGLKTSDIWKAAHIELDEQDRFEDHYDQLVDPDETRFLPGAAITTRLFSDQYKPEELGPSVGRFFPEVPETEKSTYRYPMPLSEDFWYQYAEPLGDFRHAIQGVREILDKLSQSGPLDKLPSEQLRAVVESRSRLHSLLLVSPALALETDGSYAPTWAFSSLLSMFGLAIWQELVSGGTLRHCSRHRCRKLFFVGRRNQQYCSVRCRQAEEKARQRQSNRSQ